MKNRAFFLDRDGTVIREKGYICDFSQVDIFPFSVEAVKAMNDAGFKVIVVTNQSAVARGICTEKQVQDLHAGLEDTFREGGATIDAFYYCPFHEEGDIEEYRKKSPLRKPSPGMILQAAADFNIDLVRSFLVGDHGTDILAGKNAGCGTVLVLTGKGERSKKELERENIYPDYVAADLLEAVKLIL